MLYPLVLLRQWTRNYAFSRNFLRVSGCIVPPFFFSVLLQKIWALYITFLRCVQTKKWRETGQEIFRPNLSFLESQFNIYHISFEKGRIEDAFLSSDSILLENTFSSKMSENLENFSKEQKFVWISSYCYNFTQQWPVNFYFVILPHSRAPELWAGTWFYSDGLTVPKIKYFGWLRGNCNVIFFH